MIFVTLYLRKYFELRELTLVVDQWNALALREGVSGCSWLYTPPVRRGNRLQNLQVQDWPNFAVSRPVEALSH